MLENGLKEAGTRAMMPLGEPLCKKNTQSYEMFFFNWCTPAFHQRKILFMCPTKLNVKKPDDTSISQNLVLEYFSKQGTK